MIQRAEYKIVIYTSALIAFILSIPSLLTLRDQAILADYWTFNLWEYLMQLILIMAFCIVFFRLNFRFWTDVKASLVKKIRWSILYSLALYSFAVVISCFAAKFLFDNAVSNLVIIGFYGVRFGLSAVSIFALLRIILLIREIREKDQANNELKNAMLTNELALLKSQINPHFFFNALTSLSTLVREDAEKAQLFIKYLSRYFRNSLVVSDENLITLKEEINNLSAYIELMRMRFEKRLIFEISEEAAQSNKKIVQTSLQPLVENAIKHNSHSVASPLKIEIDISGDWLIIRNNLQILNVESEGSGVGLTNLEERSKLFVGASIQIHRTDDYFEVKLPLKK